MNKHLNGYEVLKREVIDAGLCTRCGSCVGLCPSQGLFFREALGECLPVAKEQLSCSNCTAPCWKGCSGKEVNFVELNKEVFGKLPEDFLLGNASEYYIAWANDKETRRNGSSGGALTAIAKHLLERGVVKGIVCLIDDPKQPLVPQPVIATNWETLRLSQQSKYSLAPLNIILREVQKFDGPLVYVGLPHQVQSLRKLQRIGHPSVRNIKAIFGLYCGSVQHFTSIVSFLKKHGISNLDKVKKIEYRAGKWPGKLRITLNNEEKYELDKFYANYMTLFYAVKRSLLCIDLSNELADLSFGDAWASKYEDCHDGYSFIVVRTETGKGILKDGEKDGIISVISKSRDDAIKMHSHGLYNKKVAVWSRIDLRRWLRKEVPDYGYRPVRSLSAKGVGLLIALIFAFGQTDVARWVVQRLPLEFTGKIFSMVRKVWRGATGSKKRKSFTNTYNVNIDN